MVKLYLSASNIKKKSKKGKVLMAMSGGIDSTMAALMLHKERYEVIGITMKTCDYTTSGGNNNKQTCC